MFCQIPEWEKCCFLRFFAVGRQFAGKTGKIYGWVRMGTDIYGTEQYYAAPYLSVPIRYHADNVLGAVGLEGRLQRLHIDIRF